MLQLFYTVHRRQIPNIDYLSSMTSLAHLHSLTNRLLDAPADAYGELFTLCDELYQYLTGITSVNTDDASNREQVLLSSGKAIGLTWAGMCIKDLMRTKKFMDGLFNAVTDVLSERTASEEKRNDRPVHILYAGTGPFATLVLPLTARFSPAQVQFTFLEINEYSFDCLQKLIGSLELQPYIRKIEKADATVWTIDPEEPIDIFLSETMNQGLTKEPQVAIYMNMIPQLPAETILIPEMIRLDLALVDTKKQMHYNMGETTIKDFIFPLATVFELNRSTILAHANAFQQSTGEFAFPLTAVSIPETMAGTELNIITTIMIYDSFQLLNGETALTLPLQIKPVLTGLPCTLRMHYQMGKEPGIRLEN